MFLGAFFSFSISLDSSPFSSHELGEMNNLLFLLLLLLFWLAVFWLLFFAGALVLLAQTKAAVPRDVCGCFSSPLQPAAANNKTRKMKHHHKRNESFCARRSPCNHLRRKDAKIIPF